MGSFSHSEIATASVRRLLLRYPDWVSVTEAFRADIIANPRNEDVILVIHASILLTVL